MTTIPTAGEKIYEWDRNPRMPVPAPPAGSCDCQFHIYHEPGQFPPRSNPPYPPIESATFEEARRMHKAIGFARGVIVHSAIYGSDHRLLLHALERLNDRRIIGVSASRRPSFGQRSCALARRRGARVALQFRPRLYPGSARGGDQTLDGPAARTRLACAAPRNGEDLLKNSILLRHSRMCRWSSTISVMLASRAGWTGR